MKRADSTHRFLTLVNDFYRDAEREEPVFEFEPIAAVEVVVEDRSVREEADRADAPSPRNPDGSSRY